MLFPYPDLIKKYKIQPSSVIHVGANSGQEAKWYFDNGVCAAVFIEAIPSIYEELKNNLKKYRHVLTFPINACVSDVDGKEVDFHISSNHGESSSFLNFGTHAQIHPDVTFIDSVKMTTKKMSTIFLEEGLNPRVFEFLNIDIQGTELLALKGMGEILENIEYAYIEVNKKQTYDGCALVEEIDDYLKKYDILRVETMPWVGDTWTDAFYMKKNLIKK